MVEEIRTHILDTIIDKKTNRINHFCLRKKWYEEKNSLDVYNSIYTLTSFLNAYPDVTLRERIYYIQKNYNTVWLCPYCGVHRLKYASNLSRFRTRCSDVECKSKQVSIQTIKNNKEMTDIKKAEKAYKCSAANMGTLVDKYGATKAAEIKQKMRMSNVGRKQSYATIKKRIESRKNNGIPWHTSATKNKIKKSNMVTHISDEFRSKYKEIYKQARKKQSITIKNKILNGTFTPCITNSWTRWKAYITDNGVIKHFRSNWDAAFWLLNKQTEYEKLRLPYVINNTTKIYIVDFIDNVNKIVYEIKPNSLLNNDINIIKQNCVKDWCIKNGYIYESITDDWFKHNVCRIDFNAHPNLKKSFKKFICQ